MGVIRVRGARQHNLTSIDLDLPSDGFVVFAGRSGSGKSSLAFDTLHAEGQRRYVEALSMRMRQAVGGLPRADVDEVSGLPPTLALAQHGGTLGRGSSVGTFSELDAVLKILWSRGGTPHDPHTGAPLSITPHDRIVATLMAKPDGTRVHVESPVFRRSVGVTVVDEISRAGFSRVRVDGEVIRLDALDPARARRASSLRVVVDRIKLGPERRDRVHDAVRTASLAGQGVVVAVFDDTEETFIQRPFSLATESALPEIGPALFRAAGPDACPTCAGSRQVDGVLCETCGGTGLGAMALAVRFEGLGWTDVQHATLAHLHEQLRDVQGTAVSTPVLTELRARLDTLIDVGLGHLQPGQRADALSAGETQRLRLARQLGADLTGVLFVLDEPTTGLAPAQVGALIERLRRLQRAGNGLVVVEHHPAVLAAADRVVEFGPGPGTEGGRVVFDGPPSGLWTAETPTGDAWRAPVLPREDTLEPEGWLTLEAPEGRNLRGDTLRVALGRLTCLVGPSGSGKTAVLEALAAHLAAALGGEGRPAGRLLGAQGLQRVLSVDDASARRSRRSMPATYVGLWDTMRELLAATQEARVRGMTAATFSLNVAGGRCESCSGLGVQRVDLGVLPSVDVICDVCDGQRFASDVLEVRWKGRSAAELLALSAREALPLLAGHPRLEEALRALRDVGLGYVALGQPAHTLSGGEGRRLKLAKELVRAARRGAEDTVFLLDEPTAGLHPADVAELAVLLHRLVREGATVVVATHHESLGATASHEIVMGPGVGPDGGRVVREGPPAAALDVDALA